METYQKDIIFADDKTQEEINTRLSGFMERFLTDNNLTNCEPKQFRVTWITRRHVHLEVDVEKLGAKVELG